MNLFILLLIVLIMLFGWLYYQTIRVIALLSTEQPTKTLKVFTLALNAFMALKPSSTRKLSYYRTLFTGEMYRSMDRFSRSLNAMSERQHEAFNRDLDNFIYVLSKFGTARIATPIALKASSAEMFLSELAKVQAAFHNLQHGDGRDPLAREWFNQSRAFADQHHLDLDYVIASIDNWLTNTSTDHWVQNVYRPNHEVKGASHD